MDKYLIRLPKPKESQKIDATENKVAQVHSDVKSNDEESNQPKGSQVINSMQSDATLNDLNVSSNEVESNKENLGKIDLVPKGTKAKYRRASAPATYEINDTDEDEAELSPIPTQKNKRKSTNTKQTASKSKKNKIEGLTLEQHRRKMGDAVKSRLSMEKYCMRADCHATVDMPMEVFKQLVVPHASKLTPDTFTATTPVVVALIKGREAAGEVFGKSKIRGGNKYEQRDMEKCDVVYFPASGKARIWWIMYHRWGEEDLSDEE